MYTLKDIKLENINHNDSYAEFYTEARFATALILYPILCVIGLIGNTLSIVVMSRRQMTSSTNVYLLALSISDLIKVISDFMYFTVVLLIEVNKSVGNKVFGFLYPYAHYIFNATVCTSAWLVVSVAVERYIYVCHPAKVTSYCTISSARVVCISVFVSMSLMSIPYAMRYQTVELQSHGSVYYSLNVTDLWQNQTFATAYTWCENCLRSIIPLVALSILNTCIICGLRGTGISKRRTSTRHRITVMLISVIVVFLVCIAPDAVMSFFGLGYYEEDSLARGIREITDLLLLLNASVNFILYCIFNTIFWRNFKAIFFSPCNASSAQIEDSAYRRVSCTGKYSPSKLNQTGLLCEDGVNIEEHEHPKDHKHVNGDIEECL